MSHCVICFEDIDAEHFYKLECNHAFHTHCMYDFLKHDTNMYRIMGLKYIKHVRFRCPLCRSNISDNDLRQIISYPFEKYKSNYHNNKKILKNLKSQHMVFTYKYKFKKMFNTPCLYEEQQFLIGDGKFINEICIQQTKLYMLKEKYQESKNLYLTLILR